MHTFSTPHPCASRADPDAACRPAAEAYCHRCGKVTLTAILNLRSGLIGNCCATCRACRKGRPYLGRWASELQNHDAEIFGQGVNHEYPVSK